MVRQLLLKLSLKLTKEDVCHVVDVVIGLGHCVGVSSLVLLLSLSLHDPLTRLEAPLHLRDSIVPIVHDEYIQLLASL